MDHRWGLNAGWKKVLEARCDLGMQWGAVEGKRFNTILSGFSAGLGNWFKGNWAGYPQRPWKVGQICYWVQLQMLPRQLSPRESLGWEHWLLIPSCHQSFSTVQCTCHSRKCEKMKLPEFSCYHKKLADYTRDGKWEGNVICWPQKSGWGKVCGVGGEGRVPAL